MGKTIKKKQTFFKQTIFFRITVFYDNFYIQLFLFISDNFTLASKQRSSQSETNFHAVNILFLTHFTMFTFIILF
jgi:hypothetical protein